MQEASELRKLGITDEDTIERAIKLKDNPENAGLTIRQAGNIMQFEGVTRRELVEGKTREKIQEQVTNLVGGDKELGKQILGYLDQRFDLNTNQIEERIQNEEKEGNREQNNESREQSNESKEQQNEEKETKAQRRKRERKEGNHELRGSAVSNYNEMSGKKEPGKDDATQQQGNGKHPIKNVAGVKKRTIGSNEKESEERKEEIKQKEEEKKNTKINFKL